jgi:hypothetical protein
LQLTPFQLEVVLPLNLPLGDRNRKLGTYFSDFADKLDNPAEQISNIYLKSTSSAGPPQKSLHIIVQHPRACGSKRVLYDLTDEDERGKRRKMDADVLHAYNSHRRVVSGSNDRFAVIVQGSISSGASSFLDFSATTFVDKTLVIEAFLRNRRSHHLVLRPRRCGKSFTLSMLRRIIMCRHILR